MKWEIQNNTINPRKRKIRWKSEAADSTETALTRPSHLILVQTPIFNGGSEYSVVELSPHLNPRLLHWLLPLSLWFLFLSVFWFLSLLSVSRFLSLFLSRFLSLLFSLVSVVLFWCALKKGSQCWKLNHGSWRGGKPGAFDNTGSVYSCG